jgi:hypothetical protein
MITKKLIERDVEVVKTEKRLVEVYEFGGRVYSTEEAAIKSLGEDIGKKMSRIIKTIRDYYNMTDSQLIQTITRKLEWYGSGKPVIDDLARLKELVEMIELYKAIGG